MEYYIPLIFVLYYYPVVCLVGNANNICYKQVRVEEVVQTGYNSTAVIPRHQTVPVCCKGYNQVGDQCEAICAPGCANGNCSEPNGCDCFQNYFGDLCGIKRCKAGYTGQYCNEACPKNTYGLECKNKCTCQNANCNPVNGECECYDGWSGQNCSTKCKCQNGGKCIPNNTECQCPPGFSGSTCEMPCGDTFWGLDCKNECECGGDGCNEINGECISSCEVGFYGKKCKEVCLCDRTGTKTCLRDTGKCVCNLGFVGDRCERLEVCPLMKFGAYCDNTCVCVTNHTTSCNQTTGQCKCIRGWFGETCNQRCECENGNCDEQGICSCYPGWEGNLCNDKCSEGYYGQDCMKKCSLPDSSYYECNYVNGPICKPGYGGKNCTVPCVNGRYGSGCVLCSCNQATSKFCNRYTGDCECQPGWHGNDCGKPCPSGSYGENCKSSCLCPECRNTDGFCRCQAGWEGTTCQEYCPITNYNLQTRECSESNLSRYVSDKSTRSFQSIVLIASIVCGIVLIIVVLILIVFCVRRRRKKRYNYISKELQTTTANGFEEGECEISPPSTPIYEEIPYEYVADPYNHLLHIEDEPGYLMPTDTTGQQDATEKISSNTFAPSAGNDRLLYNDHLLRKNQLHPKITSSSAAFDEKRKVSARYNVEILRHPDSKKMQQFNLKIRHLSMDTTSPQHKVQTNSLDVKNKRPRYTPAPSLMSLNYRKSQN